LEGNATNDIGAHEYGSSGIPPASIIADFTARPTSGSAPLVVQFTDASRADNGIDAWRWTLDEDMGPVEFATIPNPSLTGRKPGSYTIALTVSGPDGSDTAVRPNLIQVFPVTAGCEGNLLVNGDFSAGLSGWTFYSAGDGTIRLEGSIAVVHVRNAAGNTQLFQAPVAITGEEAYQLSFDIRSRSKNLDVWVALLQHAAPYANLGLDEKVNVTPDGQTVTLFFTATASESNARFRLMFGSDDDDILLSDFCLIVDDVESRLTNPLRFGTQLGLPLRH
jgi:PKD repeat protein